MRDREVACQFYVCEGQCTKVEQVYLESSVRLVLSTYR